MFREMILIEELYLVWLSMLSGVGSRKLKKLFERHTLEELYKDGVEGFDVLNDTSIKEKAKRSYEIILKEKIDVISIWNPSYPKLLKEIYDPPYVIYATGKKLDCVKPVSIVGSRVVDKYGVNEGFDIAKELALDKFTVVSGMAKGIDSYAHKGCLSGGGYTVAVLGTGIDITYPMENIELRMEIEESGTVVSEYPPYSAVKAGTFAARNRIISGLGIATVVIEAGEKSGSLITANFALEQGREVFALPGEIGKSQSFGTNALIKDGAVPIVSKECLVRELNELCSIYDEAFYLGTLELEEKKIIFQLSSSAMSFEDLKLKLDICDDLLTRALTMLEMKGVIYSEDNKFRIKSGQCRKMC